MKKKKHKALKVIFIILSVVIISLIVFVIYVNSQISKEIDLSLIRTGASSVTKIYYFDRENGEIDTSSPIELKDEQIFLQKHEWFSFYDMPKSLSNAFIAIEDHRFYEHNGVNWMRTGEATLNYIKNWGKSEFGGSTITQQLVKNLTGDNKPTPKRKLEEIFRAMNLEKKLGKNEILELYLNVVYLANNCYGVGTASQMYFGKDASDLTIAECASLAAIVKNPNKYDPYNNPQNNLERRNLILSQMLSQKMISDKEYNDAVNEELVVNSNIDNEKSSGVYSWYTEALIDDVIEDLMKKHNLSYEGAYMLVAKGGLRIYSTIDPNVQKEAEKVFEDYKSYILPQSDGSYPEAGCVILDPQTSDVLAVIGGVGKKSANRIFNRAYDAKRPLGSVIKPLSVYAPAIENRVLTYGTAYDDVPLEYNNGAYWPHNSPNKYRGLVSVNYAVEHSINTVAVKALKDLGINESYNFLRNNLEFSLDENDRSEAPLALGQLTNGESLLKTTNAYTIFANGGSLYEPRTYLYVTDNYGNVILENEASSKKVISKETSSIMNIMLQNVVKNGTASTVSLKNVSIAGKTGTSSDNKDKWFIGYTPDYACGVWVGYDTPRNMSYSKNPAIEYFNAIMSKLENSNESLFLSGDIVESQYCVDSGKLPSDSCFLDPRVNRVQTGYFIRGTEPKESCDIHKEVYIDTETGNIATNMTSYLYKRKISLLNYARMGFLNDIETWDKRYFISSRVN